jgi:hypothetical protein
LHDVACTCHRSPYPAGQGTARCRRRATSLLHADEASGVLQAPWPHGRSPRPPEARVSSATDIAHCCRDRVHHARAPRRDLTFSLTYKDTRSCALYGADMPVPQRRTIYGITFAYTDEVKPGHTSPGCNRLRQTRLSEAGQSCDPPPGEEYRNDIQTLGILLCIGVMSLVSGCYCYPPDYYPHPHRHSSVSPY